MSLPQAGNSIKVGVPRHWRPLKVDVSATYPILWYSANPANDIVEVTIKGVQSGVKVDTLGQYLGSCFSHDPVNFYDVVHYFME